MYFNIDPWGRAILNPEKAFELALMGHDIWSMLAPGDHEIMAQHNQWCDTFDHPEGKIDSPEVIDKSPTEYHRDLSRRWTFPAAYREIPVRELLLSLCDCDKAIERVNAEMDVFERENLESVLQLMIFLVDDFRRRGIVWGVGRGSSVASYVLFLIGIHKIDALKYDLDFREFIKTA